LLNAIFNWSSLAYSAFIRWVWILLFPIIFVAYRNKNEILCLILALLTLVFSRASVLSILDYYAVAPVSALYLASGTFALFIMELLACGYFAQLMINRSNHPSSH
jgi:hypothetical protein